MSTSSEIAQLYFDLSNQADLSAIEKLIHPEATYSSVNTGLYYGIENIMLMMRAFFDQYQSLQWQIKSIEQLDQHITELYFDCEACKNNSEIDVFSGVERIVVVGGLIRYIEVR
ncbi:nuclear transport factor 2 family protein [Marinicella sp. S1101]|uniref:nuclear transport factor 2 family protein n=1 Tax=Marinicella marina TaxID=2996016 RepID=UPI002260E454|nr:nuclear transport factor 2 family protein [Marinicella marina]MCX7554292.1 nuclear transport factor 2 family protein [Marinicella marina]MDJ1138717.1 nuclear transport factor 2 family protein [Marinicella marina]